MASNQVLWIVHDPISETLDPCIPESELKSQTWQSAHVTMTKSGRSKHCRGSGQEWPAQALPWQLEAALAGALDVMAGWAGVAGPAPDVQLQPSGLTIYIFLKFQ